MAIKKELVQVGWQNCVGASGTVRSIHKILRFQGSCDDEICLEGLYQLRDRVLSFERLEDIEMEGLSETRAPILPSGLAILIAIFESLKIHDMRYSTGALREGVLYDLLGRIQHEDVRDRTVQALMQRYRVNVERSEAIKSSALALLKLLGNSVLEDKQSAALLSWAALLHQIGLSVSHSQFQRHGSYLIRYSDLPGFSKKEQAFLAAIINNHRRKYMPLKKNSSLYDQKNDFDVLSVCLRLAILFHRGHNEPNIPELQFTQTNDGYALDFSEEWLVDNPLLHADLILEQAYLKEVGIELL